MSKKLDIKHLPSLDSLILSERTSITRYEAVEFLMELSGLNPPRLLPLSEGAMEEEIEIGESITVLDMLKNDVDGAESEYDIAKFGDEPLTDSVIAEKLKKIKQTKLILAQAHDFLCTIDDELSKGTLRSPSRTTHPQPPDSITVKSFMEWVEQSQYGSNAGEGKLPVRKAKRKQLDQEEAIKKLLSEYGYKDLMNLPKPKRGLAGPRAEIQSELLAMTELFPSEKTFEKAWGRLISERQEIAYAEPPTPKILK